MSQIEIFANDLYDEKWFSRSVDKKWLFLGSAVYREYTKIQGTEIYRLLKGLVILS